MPEFRLASSQFLLIGEGQEPWSVTLVLSVKWNHKYPYKREAEEDSTQMEEEKAA